MDRRNRIIRTLRTAVALALVALYAAGLVAMLMGRVRLALILWVISTLGGIALLFGLNELKKRREAEGADGAPGSGED